MFLPKGRSWTGLNILRRCVRKSNGFEEMVAIQLAVRSWPGQAKLSAKDLGLKDGEVPAIFP